MERSKEKLYVIQSTNPNLGSMIAIGIWIDEGYFSYRSITKERIFEIAEIMDESDDALVFSDESNYVYRVFLMGEKEWIVLKSSEFVSKSKMQTMNLEEATAFLVYLFDPYIGGI